MFEIPELLRAYFLRRKRSESERAESPFPEDSVDLPGGAVAAHSAKFDVDDPACAKRDCRLCVAQAVDAFIKTDRGPELWLQQGVLIDLVPRQRLLNVAEPEVVQLLEQIDIFEAVRGVGVDGKVDLGIALSHGLDEGDIFARFDLELDALIAIREFSGNGVERFAGIGLNPKGDTGGDLRHGAAEGVAEALALRVKESHAPHSMAALAISCPRTASIRLGISSGVATPKSRTSYAR
jgi:hypothetical protein